LTLYAFKSAQIEQHEGKLRMDYDSGSGIAKDLRFPLDDKSFFFISRWHSA
jgi:hypothetical protein